MSEQNLSEDSNTQADGALAGQVDPSVMRLRKKLAKRDRRIEALEKRIAVLERALSTRTLDLESLSRNVERSVTNALCNVRMIPVFGHGRDSKIVEIKSVDV